MLESCVGRFAKALVLTTTISACQVAVQPSAGSEGSETIINGRSPSRAEHTAVAALHTVDPQNPAAVGPQPFCSSTLIAETASEAVVLTAAHCVYGGGAQQVLFANNTFAYFGNDPAQDLTSHVYEACDVLVNPNYFPYVPGVNDLALIRLKKTVTEADPVARVTSSAPLTQGENLNHAGFGVTSPGGASGVKLQVDTTLDEIWGQHIVYSQPNGGPCSGDSGGPQFVERNGALHLAGVTSFGDANCQQAGVSTRVDAYHQFISDFLAGHCP